MLGAMAAYISDSSVRTFTPMNANFGLVAPLDRKIRNKKEKYLAYAQRSLQEIDSDSPLLDDFFAKKT
jgi:methylenetetrahydrofolate--tRNA-(uracil-5-)-methyltransferase